MAVRLIGRFYPDEHGLDFIALRIGWMCEHRRWDLTDTMLELD